MCLFCVEGVLPCPVLVLSYKGPRKLQLKLQKKQLSSIHITTFSPKCNTFLNSFTWTTIFTMIFYKNRCEIVLVCGGLNMVFIKKNALICMSYARSLILEPFLFLDGGAEKLLCAVGSRFLRLRLTQPEFCSSYVWWWTRSLSK